MSLRILIVPYVASIDLFSSSDIRDMYVLAQEIMRQDERVYFLFAVPDRVPRADLPKHDRLHWVYYKQNYYTYGDESHTLSGNFLEAFNQRIGHFQVDLVWTTRCQLAGYLALLSQDARSTEMSLPVVVHELMPVSSQNIVGKNRFDLMARAFSYYAGFPLFLTETEKEHAMRLVGRYCSGHIVDEIRAKAQVMTPGQEVTKIRELAATVEKKDPKEEFHLIHAGRLNANKRVPDILKMYEYVRASGMPTKITICTADKKEKKYAAMYEACPELILKVSLPREQYYRELCTAHAFVVNSIGEALCNSWVEEVMAGVLPVLKANMPYTTGFLGKLSVEYPFQWKSSEEAIAMLQWIRDNYVEALPWLVRLQEQLAHSSNDVAVAAWLRNYMGELVEAMEEEYKWGGNGTWREPMQTALALMPEQFNLPDFMEMFRLSCKHVSRQDIKNPFFKGIPSLWGAYKFLKHSGVVEDDMQRPYPTFRRIRKDRADGQSADVQQRSGSEVVSG